jgi:N-acetylmuramoyl-L-alanine amidase
MDLESSSNKASRRSRRDFLGALTLGGALLWADPLSAAPGLKKPEKLKDPLRLEPKPFEWKIFSHEERDYVCLKDIKTFYKFVRYDRDGRHLWLRSDTLMLKVTHESDDLFLNNVKFCMSYPAISHAGDLWISRMDLAKMVEPVLRPRFIQQPLIFDTVIIDPGHGGEDPGTKGVLGWEKDYALDTSLRLKKLVEAAGLKTKLTRSTDVFIEKPERAKIANAVPNSIFVSVHYNSGGRRGSSASGVETYALSPHGAASTDQPSRMTDLQDFSGNERDSENIALATAVHAMVLYKMKCLDRGIRRARWTVLTGLERPGILFEGGFITNSEEGARVHTETHRQGLAEALCQGIIRYREVLIRRHRR